jgi:hypothetical protein
MGSAAGGAAAAAAAAAAAVGDAGTCSLSAISSTGSPGAASADGAAASPASRAASPAACIACRGATVLSPNLQVARRREQSCPMIYDTNLHAKHRRHDVQALAFCSRTSSRLAMEFLCGGPQHPKSISGRCIPPQGRWLPAARRRPARGRWPAGGGTRAPPPPVLPGSRCPLGSCALAGTRSGAHGTAHGHHTVRAALTAQWWRDRLLADTTQHPVELKRDCHQR